MQHLMSLLSFSKTLVTLAYVTVNLMWILRWERCMCTVGAQVGNWLPFSSVQGDVLTVKLGGRRELCNHISRLLVHCSVDQERVESMWLTSRRQTSKYGFHPPRGMWMCVGRGIGGEGLDVWGWGWGSGDEGKGVWVWGSGMRDRCEGVGCVRLRIDSKSWWT